MLDDTSRVAKRVPVGQQALLKLKTQLPRLTKATRRLRILENARVEAVLRFCTGEYVQVKVGGTGGAPLIGPGVGIGPNVFNGYKELALALYSDGEFGAINELGYFILSTPDEVKAALSRDEILELARIFEAVSRAYMNYNDFNYDSEMDTLHSVSGRKHSEEPYSQTYGHPQGQIKQAYKLSVIAANLRDLAE